MLSCKYYITALAVAITVIGAVQSPAGSPPPQAPADISWLPHGYGYNMNVDNTLTTLQKGLHGFRKSPEYIGCWSHPLWGWDVNGFYYGPNAPQIDPVDHQLPIGLVYPENSPMAPPPFKAVRK
jgi:hypothetical protein